ncbi:MAG TPA: DNA-binding response regulator [Ruminococcaceae bacterium]|nr:DNA-binding response regulator [Oscillospiraceae bacterium]HCD81961.1 DNA-binding response regulator [Oscillospiraceae bacterium]
MADIFIVEDDPVIAREMDNFLTSWGHNVKCAQDFKNVTAEFADFNPQLVLLDISLPFFNGYCRCREIRKLSDVPIIFISSAADNMNIVTAVNMGGDDFLAKPFDLSVLNAKVQAILRRTYELSGAGNLKEHRGAVLNKQSAAVSYHGKSAELTKNEYRILLTLMEKSGKIVTRESIMEQLWQDESFVDENTLTVNVTRLRKKLESIGLADFITTKKGIGYIIK